MAEILLNVALNTIQPNQNQVTQYYLLCWNTITVEIKCPQYIDCKYHIIFAIKNSLEMPKTLPEAEIRRTYNTMGKLKKDIRTNNYLSRFCRL